MAAYMHCATSIAFLYPAANAVPAYDLIVEELSSAKRARKASMHFEVRESVVKALVELQWYSVLHEQGFSPGYRNGYHKIIYTQFRHYA